MNLRLNFKVWLGWRRFYLKRHYDLARRRAAFILFDLSGLFCAWAQRIFAETAEVARDEPQPWPYPIPSGITRLPAQICACCGQSMERGA